MYRSPEEINQLADQALSRFMSRYGAALPINPEKLLETEYDMQIIPIPGLRALGGFECSFSRDGTTILVDQDDYENELASSRLTFTFAHELGHKIMHEQYALYVDELTDAQIRRLETQSGMFAAMFLMPEPILLGVIATEIIDRFEQIARTELSLDACVSYSITSLANYFGVSNLAMENRIKNIDLGKVLRGPYISPDDKSKFIGLAKSVSKNPEGLWAVQLRQA
jgi:Zn-dependent peptidase ImmA (M78 family)